MLALTRCVVPEPDQPSFTDEARAALAALATRPGFVRGSLGRNADDPTLWVLATEWEAVGAYRRGLSAYDVKLALAPLMAFVVNEPGAYEVLSAQPAAGA